MDDRTRLIYLPRHYYELQGVRFAPLWIAYIASLVYNSLPGHWIAQGPAGRVLPLLTLYAAEILWYWLASRYYRSRFGQLEPSTPGIINIGFNWWWIFFTIVEFGNRHPIVGLPILILLILPAFDSKNPPVRRIEYAVGSALIAIFGTLSSVCGWSSTAFIAIACMTALALSLADHLLLMSLRSPFREGVDA